MTVIRMSERELTRLRVLIDLSDKRLTVDAAGTLMGLGRRSAKPSWPWCASITQTSVRRSRRRSWSRGIASVLGRDDALKGCAARTGKPALALDPAAPQLSATMPCRKTVCPPPE